MPNSTYIPRRESDLLSFSANFNAKINADPVSLGLTVEQAAAYSDLHDALVAARSLLQDPDTRTQPNTVTKNEAKAALIAGPDGIRQLVGLIKRNPMTMDAQRAELRLTIPDPEPSPVSAPAVAPNLSIIWTAGRFIKVRLGDQENATSRAKPAGVDGVTVLYHIGEKPPADPAEWRFARNASTTEFDVNMPASIAAGSRVWLTAFWFNARKDPSPAATAASACISGGLARAA